MQYPLWRVMRQKALVQTLPKAAPPFAAHVPINPSSHTGKIRLVLQVDPAKHVPVAAKPKIEMQHPSLLDPQPANDATAWFRLTFPTWMNGLSSGGTSPGGVSVSGELTKSGSTIGGSRIPACKETTFFSNAIALSCPYPTQWIILDKTMVHVG